MDKKRLEKGSPLKINSQNDEAVELEESSSLPTFYIVGLAAMFIVIVSLVLYIRKLKKEN